MSSFCFALLRNESSGAKHRIQSLFWVPNGSGWTRALPCNALEQVGKRFLVLVLLYFRFGNFATFLFDSRRQRTVALYLVMFPGEEQVLKGTLRGARKLTTPALEQGDIDCFVYASLGKASKAFLRAYAYCTGIYGGTVPLRHCQNAPHSSQRQQPCVTVEAIK